MNNLYLVLDFLLGNIPRRYLIAEVVAGSVITITGVIDMSLRILVAIVTVLVAYYTVKNHRASTRAHESAIKANNARAALDELTIRIKEEELTALRVKNASSDNP